jgi:hypothetical protein
MSIERGLHSCQTEGYALVQRASDRFPAIIPVGSTVWFGRRGDIASNQLIVYETMADLLAVHGRVTKPKHYSELVEAA